MIERAAIGLTGTCAALDDDAADSMRKLIVPAHQAIRLVAPPEQQEDWLSALAGLARLENGHGLLRGLAVRLRFDLRADEPDTTARYLSQALSIGPEPDAAAAWLEGFLNQNALVLLHDDSLWTLVDGWVAGLGEEHFLRVLPLIRRTFASFQAAERRQLGEKAKQASALVRPPTRPSTWEQTRAELPLPLLRTVLGVSA